MKNFFKTRKALLSVLLLAVIAFFVWILWADKAVTVREFEKESEEIPACFDGFRIAQVSDLHNAAFGKGNEKLTELLKEISPDIIAVTGDIIDSRRTNIKVAEDFIVEALKIAPVYYVTGNHESRIADFEKLLTFMKSSGVIIAEGENLIIEREGGSITLCGISDPAFKADYLLGDENAVVSSSLEKLGKSENFRVLLSHRPEFFELYAEGGFDLVLSGHAHGGQFRLPFIGGLVAPGQGFFPKYDSGLYEENGTSMIVSRGIGNSIIPIRFNNRPEIIVVTLKEAAK